MIHPNRSFYWKATLRNTKSNLVIFFIFVLLIAGLGLLMYGQIARRLDLDAPQYNGKIVDKWRSVSETYEGSLIRGVILVEDNSGRRIQIRVSEKLYSEAKIGDQIANSSGKVEFVSE